MSRFIFSNENPDGTYSLYSTDGTAAGTTDLQAARFGFIPGNVPDPGFVNLNGNILFVGLGITYSGILDVIYRSDGSAIGTSDSLIAGTGGSLSPTGLWSIGKDVLTSGVTTAGPQGLYSSTDGVTFTEIETGAGVGPGGIVVSNDIGYFGAVDANGKSLGLWRTDGTPAGTYSITPAGQTLDPAELVTVGSKLVFSSTPPGGVTTLWTTDGTATNTIPLQVPGLANVYSETNLLSLGSKALFVASPGPDAYGVDGLWATDGTVGGTTEIYSGAYPNQLSPTFSLLGSKAVFSNGTNLLITDGTATGTFVIPTPTTSIQSWVVLGSSVIYTGVGTSQSEAGANSLFSYDSNTGATVQLTLPGVNIDQSTLTLVNNQVVLAATDPSGTEAFYATDGTQAGTQELALPAGVALTASGSTVLAGLPDTAPPPSPTPPVVTLTPNQNYVAAAGTTILASSSGTDTVTASAGQVTVVGSSGSLAFIGGTGASSVAGGAGSSTIFGGSGGGYFTGGRSGFNVLVSQGASGANTTLTGAGAGDQIFGSGNGNDMLIAGSGRTSILGGSGHTTIEGGATASVVFTGGGSSIVFGGSGGGDTVVGGGGSLNVNAQNGDAIFGGSGALNVTGSKTGADSIIGGSGSLTVNGQGGNMLVVAGTGTSSINVGNGASLIFAGSGSSSVTGGAGSLQLLVGSGSTTITEGTGPAVYDVIKGSAGGTDVLNGFRPGSDQIQLFGYTAPDPTITISNGSSLISFSDGTKLQIVGVTDLGNSIIIG